MAMDTAAIRKMLKELHEVDEKLVDPNLSSLPAIQTALLCDIADSLRSLAASSHPYRDGVFHVDMRQLGVDPQLLEAGIRRGIEMAVREARQRDYDYGQSGALDRKRYGPRIDPMDYRSEHEARSVKETVEEMIRRRPPRKTFDDPLA